MKNLSAAISVVFLMLAVTLGCSIKTLVPGWMDAGQAADQVMQALRDGDYERAAKLMRNDDKRAWQAKAKTLKEKIEAENLQPQSWTLEAEYVSGPGTKGNNSFNIITGKVVFKDGSTGTIQTMAFAKGLRQNPWSFSDFELKR